MFLRKIFKILLQKYSPFYKQFMSFFLFFILHTNTIQTIIPPS